MKKFRKVVLYVVRTNVQGVFQESAPCADCMEVIKSLKIKRVVYTGMKDGVMGIWNMEPPDYKATHITTGKRSMIRQRQRESTSRCCCVCDHG